MNAFALPRGLGVTLMAPLRVRLWARKFREPDVVFMLAEHESRIGQQFWDGADLVMQVVSDDDRRRDLETKRREYALAHIPEYWIIDPQSMTIVVLALEGGEYQEHGRFATGQAAASRLLSDFRVDVTSVFAAAKRFSES